MIFPKRIDRSKRLFFSTFFLVFAFCDHQKSRDERFVTFVAEPKKQELRFFWKDEKGANFKSLERLKTWLGERQKTLVFAMKAGMFGPDRAPKGLFIEDFVEKTPLDTSSGAGNFYLKPNGAFFLTAENEPKICLTADFFENQNVKFATQSGPMLLIDGKIHPAFKKGSTNLNIRNGVGILPDRRVIFAMSKKAVNFYDFAKFFKNEGCENALYLDGVVSRAFAPTENWVQTDGDFGPIIAVTTDKN